MGAVHAVQAAVPTMRQQQVGLDHPHRVGRRDDRVVARRAVLRHQGGGHPAWRRWRPSSTPATTSGSTVCAPARSVSAIHDDLPQEAIDAMGAKHPLGLGAAPDLAGAYSYLASDASRWTTGSALVVDGGYSAP